MESYVELPDLGFLSVESRLRLDEMLPGFNFDTFVSEITSGKNVFRADKILNLLIKIFADELYSAIKILSVIIAIIILGAILENLKASFNKSTAFHSQFVCLVLICGLAANLFRDTSMYSSEICRDVTNLMWALVPIFMTLLAGGGFTTTGLIANPILILMCNIFAEIFTRIIIPVSVSYLAISLADTISDAVELSSLRELIKKIYNFVLGLVMTLFTGVLGLGSFTGTAIDSIGAKGAKFALSNMVPFVGRSLSEALGTVASASIVLKNAVGIAGIVCVLGLCIVPIIKTAAVILCIRLAGAICEPVSNKKSIQLLSSIADSLSMINAALISVSVMMIISIAIIVGIMG